MDGGWVDGVAGWWMIDGGLREIGGGQLMAGGSWRVATRALDIRRLGGGGRMDWVGLGGS